MATEHLLIDAHAHLHECFNLDLSLQAALTNLRRWVPTVARGNIEPDKAETGDNPWSGYLMVSQLDAGTPAGSADRCQVALSGFTVGEVAEAGSVSLVCDNTGDRLALIFGNQIVTSEGLEVLVYGHDKPVVAGLALEETIKAAEAQGALTILPWGFGKWTGGRRQVLQEALDNLDGSSSNISRLFVGDSATRPAFSSPSQILANAKDSGLRNLPGSDPLPFASEHDRLGRFGFHLTGTVDPMRPLNTLQSALIETGDQPRLFGRGETVSGFFTKQIRMQARKHIPRLR